MKTLLEKRKLITTTMNRLLKNEKVCFYATLKGMNSTNMSTLAEKEICSVKNVTH